MRQIAIRGQLYLAKPPLLPASVAEPGVGLMADTVITPAGATGAFRCIAGIRSAGISPGNAYRPPFTEQTSHRFQWRTIFDMSGVQILRRAAKLLHEVASMGFGGGLAVCLLINLTARPESSGEFMAARHVYTAIAHYVVIPSMLVVVASGLIALAATRGFMNSVWAWVKALLGLSVFEATLVIVGSSRQDVELALAASNSAVLDALLRSERNTLLLLIAVTVVNVVPAVWRPRLTYQVR